jgi:stalled ribosome rescue protein Dom34
VAKYVVLWTSDSYAIIVSITDGVEEILHVDSKAKRQVEERRSQNRSEYYRKVIHTLLDAQSIFIFGPAQAKMELKSEILKTGALSHRVVGTETADTMTDDQLVARAREICGLRHR